MSEVLLSVDELRVDYEHVTAVRDVSFQVEAGMVYGLIGPNGAGKTSTMAAIATLVEATYGRVELCGVDVFEEPRRALPQLGFMPDLPPVYPDLTAREFLELFASAYGLTPGARATRIRELLGLVRLDDKADTNAGDLSRGMKQRLFLAKAMLHDPAVLILDEPASGLDPAARSELAQILRELGAAGKAVLVSSHILSELEDFCNSVGIMEQGRMVVSGRVENVLANVQPGRSMRLALVAPDDKLESFLNQREGVSDVHVTEGSASFRLEGGARESAALLKSLVEEGFELAELNQIDSGLQDIFFGLSSRRTA